MKRNCKQIVLTLILTVLIGSTVCPRLKPNASIYTKKYVSPFAVPNTPKSVDEY